MKLDIKDGKIIGHPSKAQIEDYLTTQRLGANIKELSETTITGFDFSLEDMVFTSDEKPVFAGFRLQENEIDIEITGPKHQKPKNGIKLNTKKTLTALRVRWQETDSGYNVNLEPIYQE